MPVAKFDYIFHEVPIKIYALNTTVVMYMKEEHSYLRAETIVFSRFKNFNYYYGICLQHYVSKSMFYKTFDIHSSFLCYI